MLHRRVLFIIQEGSLLGLQGRVNVLILHHYSRGGGGLFKKIYMSMCLHDFKILISLIPIFVTTINIPILYKNTKFCSNSVLFMVDLLKIHPWKTPNLYKKKNLRCPPPYATPKFVKIKTLQKAGTCPHPPRHHSY